MTYETKQWDERRIILRLLSEGLDDRLGKHSELTLAGEPKRETREERILRECAEILGEIR